MPPHPDGWVYVMSTYTDSKYVVSRRKRECDCCHLPIYVGQKYLSYAVGQRNRVNVCTLCSTTTETPSPIGKKSFKFWCKAVEDQMRKS